MIAHEDGSRAEAGGPERGARVCVVVIEPSGPDAPSRGLRICQGVCGDVMTSPPCAAENLVQRFVGKPSRIESGASDSGDPLLGADSQNPVRRAQGCAGVPGRAAQPDDERHGNILCASGHRGTVGIESRIPFQSCFLCPSDPGSGSVQDAPHPVAVSIILLAAAV